MEINTLIAYIKKARSDVRAAKGLNPTTALEVGEAALRQNPFGDKNGPGLQRIIEGMDKTSPEYYEVANTYIWLLCRMASSAGRVDKHSPRRMELLSMAYNMDMHHAAVITGYKELAKDQVIGNGHSQSEDQEKSLIKSSSIPHTNWNREERYFTSAIKSAKSKDNREQFLYLLKQGIMVAHEYGQQEFVNRWLEEGYQAAILPKQKRDFLELKGWLAETQENYAAANKYYQAMLRLNPDRKDTIFIYDLLLDNCGKMGDRVAAKEWYLKGQELLQHTSEPRQRYTAKSNLAQEAQTNGKWEEARTFLEGALIDAQELGDKRLLSWAHVRLGLFERNHPVAKEPQGPEACVSPAEIHLINALTINPYNSAAALYLIATRFQDNNVLSAQQLAEKELNESTDVMALAVIMNLLDASHWSGGFAQEARETLRGRGLLTAVQGYQGRLQERRLPVGDVWEQHMDLIGQLATHNELRNHSRAVSTRAIAGVASRA